MLFLYEIKKPFPPLTPISYTSPEELDCSVGLGMVISQESLFGFTAKPGIFLWAVGKPHFQVGGAVC